MGACQSAQDGDAEEKKKRSRAIDAKLEEDSRRLRKECKILLLGVHHQNLLLATSFMRHFKTKGCWTDSFATGSGESGKSTIVKQMKIIHQNGYTRDELALYRLTIFKNVLDCSKALIGAMEQFKIQYHNPENNGSAEYLLEYQVDPDPHTPLDPHVGECVVSIWKDGSMSEIMDHQSEFYLMDSAP